MNMEMRKAVIFDLEGTLWDGMPCVRRAWNAVLKQRGVSRHPISVKEMHGYLGHTESWVAHRMLPDLPAPLQKEIMAQCSAAAQTALEEGGGQPYPGMKTALESLRRDYDLYVVSNCTTPVLNAFLKCGYARYFEGIECTGDRGRSKMLGIRELIRHNNLHMVCYVGDTLGDWEATAVLHIPFVHAAYGMDKTMPGWVAAESPAELPQKIREIFPV